VVGDGAASNVQQLFVDLRLQRTSGIILVGAWRHQLISVGDPATVSDKVSLIRDCFL
jgi:hypothetical protein